MSTDRDTARRAWLEAARRDLTPSQQSVTALRGRLRASIATGAAPSFEAPGADEPPAGTTLSREGVRQGTSQHGALGKLVASRVSKWLAIGIAGGLTFGAGYEMGWRRAARELAVEPSSSPEASLAPALNGAHVHEPFTGIEPSSPLGPSAVAEPPAGDPPAAEPSAPEPRARDSTSSRTPLSTLAAPTRAAPPSGPPPPRTAQDLASEVALLQNAQQALRRGRPERAREWIAELDEKHPGGALREERAAVDALAACQIDSTDAAARNRGEAFLRRYPESAYGERVRTECAIGSKR